jgi:hypothetical protein
VWCPKEQDTIGRFVQGCYRCVVEFIRLHGFYEALRSPASACFPNPKSVRLGRSSGYTYMS